MVAVFARLHHLVFCFTRSVREGELRAVVIVLTNEANKTFYTNEPIDAALLRDHFFIHMCGRFDTFIHIVRFAVQCAKLKGKKQR